MSQAVETLVMDALRKELAVKGKIVTRSTYNSLESRMVGKRDGGFELTVKAGKGWFHIEVGKRANTKLPVVKEGDKWDLIEPLRTWARIKLPGVHYYPIARGIAKKARAGIPLTVPAVVKVLPSVERTIANEYARALLGVLVTKK